VLDVDGLFLDQNGMTLEVLAGTRSMTLRLDDRHMRHLFTKTSQFVCRRVDE
jgi:hypothetical protein